MPLRGGGDVPELLKTSLEGLGSSAPPPALKHAP